MFKKTILIAMLFVTAYVDVNCASVHEYKQNFVNQLLTELVDNDVISLEDSISVNEFLNGSDKKFDGSDQIVKDLKKEIGTFAKIWAWAGGSKTFEQKLLQELKQMQEEAVKSAAESGGAVNINKKDWTNFAGTIKSYLKNKPKSLKQRMFSLAKAPAYYIYAPFYTVGKYVLKKPILKVTEYMSTALQIVFIVALTKASVAPEGEFVTAFYSVFNTVFSKVFAFMFGEDRTQDMYWFDKAALIGFQYINSLLYKTIGTVF